MRPWALHLHLELASAAGGQDGDGWAMDIIFTSRKHKHLGVIANFPDIHH